MVAVENGQVACSTDFRKVERLILESHAGRAKTYATRVGTIAVHDSRAAQIAQLLQEPPQALETA